MTEYKRLQLRRDTSDNWQTENPVLMEGEIGVDLTNNNIKIGDGLKTWNELEYVSSDVDLSNYYTKDETETIVKATETTLELAIEEKVDNDTYNEKIDEIEAVLEGKANKTDIPSLDDYVTKDDYNVKMNAVDNAIATKADTETVNSRFGSVDEYLDGLRIDVDKKADASSLEDYVTKDDYDNKMNAVDNAIATKADAEETANRFNSVDGYLEDLHTEIEGKADAGSVPTKTSELTNDSGFLTEHQSLEGYATEQWVEGKGYLTEHQSLGNYYTKGETDNEIQGTKTALEGEINAKVDTTTYEGKISEIEGVLGEKADRTEIPSLAGYATEQWVEGKGYLTEHQSLDNYYTKGETDTAIQGTKDSLEGEINSKAEIMQLKTGSSLYVYTELYEDIVKWETDGNYIASYPVLFKINNKVGYYSPYMYDSLDGRITFSETYFNGLRWGNIKNRLELYSGESYILNSNGRLSVNPSSTATYVAGVAQVSDIPTKTSELTNDSGFLTEHQSLDNYYTKGEVDTAIGVAYNFNIASGNEYELIEQARAILQGIIRGEKVIVEYRNPSNTQLVTLSYDYIVEVENNQIELGIHSYNETNQNTWHFHGSDLYSLVMQTTFLQIPSNTEMWTFELEDGSTITKEIYLK